MLHIFCNRKGGESTEGANATGSLDALKIVPLRTHDIPERHILHECGGWLSAAASAQVATTYADQDPLFTASSHPPHAVGLSERIALHLVDKDQLRIESRPTSPARTVLVISGIRRGLTSSFICLPASSTVALLPTNWPPLPRSSSSHRLPLHPSSLLEQTYPCFGLFVA